MITYADTTVCPACREPFVAEQVHPIVCAACALPLQLPMTGELLSTLRRADHLVVALRAVARSTTATPPAPPPWAITPASSAPHLPGADLPGSDRPGSEPFPAPYRSGVRTASVPAILLSLGALCLLVAAVAFLAVAWSWLGVGGRTAVLVALTATAAVTGAVLARRRLRVAAESLTVVGAGLWLLDVVGADRAGWLGDLSSTTLAATIGTALAAYGVVTLVASRRLAAPQLIVPVGLLVLLLALAEPIDDPRVLVAGAVPALAALVLAGRRLGLAVLPWSIGVATSVTWLWLVALGLDGMSALPVLTWSSMWLGGPGWTLLAAGVLVLLPLVVAPRSAVLVVSCGAGTTTALTALALVPALDGGGTTLVLAALAGTVGWLLVGHLLTASRALLGPVAIVPAALLALPLAWSALELLGIAAGRVVPGTSAPDLAAAVVPVHQLLLVPSALIVVAVAHLVALHLHTGRSGRPAPAGWVAAAAATGAVAVTATVALYPVPVWAVLLLVVVVAVTVALAALQRSTEAALAAVVAALGALLLAVAMASPDAGRLTLVSGVLVVLATAIILRGRFPFADDLGGGLLPAAAAGLLWSSVSIDGPHDAVLGVPTLLIVGGIALARPRIAVELSASAAALVAVPIAVVGADHLATSAALHLTVAGALVTASSIVHPSRRVLGWLGGSLLLLATWIRLADLGIRAPEAYTVPAALALVALGLLRLRRDSEASSAMALAPGLSLMTVPSLLWVLASDPVSWRALLLGVGCLTLVLVGARLRWSAPLTIGAAVGAVLTLAEVAPYVAQAPQWIVLGATGALLTLVGVSWERRVTEVRNATHALGRLR